MLSYRVDQSIMRFLNYKSKTLLTLPQPFTSNSKFSVFARMYIRLCIHKASEKTRALLAVLCIPWSKMILVEFPPIDMLSTWLLRDIKHREVICLWVSVVYHTPDETPYKFRRNLGAFYKLWKIKFAKNVICFRIYFARKCERKAKKRVTSYMFLMLTFCY